MDSAALSTNFCCPTLTQYTASSPSSQLSQLDLVFLIWFVSSLIGTPNFQYQKGRKTLSLIDITFFESSAMAGKLFFLSLLKTRNSKIKEKQNPIADTFIYY